MKSQLKNKPELKEINLSDIFVSKTNPRKHFDEDSINELADSIKEKGVLQPIVVREQADRTGKYDLVCGERRFRASKVAGVSTIPAVVRVLTDDEAFELQIIENLQRKDVHPMEEALAFMGLMVMKKFDVGEISKRVAKSPTYVAQRLKLNELIEELQKAFYQDRMNITTAIAFAKLRAEDQKEIWIDDYADNATKIELDRWTIKKYTSYLNESPFDKEDTKLVKGVGSCTNCPHNSASNTLLFPEAATSAVCLNSSCYKMKCEVSFNNALKDAKTNPEIVLISSYWSKGKDANALIKKGDVVYDSSEYEQIHKPELPDYSEYEEGLNDGDYATAEEMKEEYSRDIEEYNADMVKYESKVQSGGVIKALLIDGTYKGTYVYVKLKTKTSSAKSKAAPSIEKGSDLDDLKSELARVETVEKRKREIDGEKIYAKIFEILQKSSFAKSNSTPSDHELRAMILFVCDSDFSTKGVINKIYKVTNDYHGRHITLFNHLKLEETSTLQKLLSLALRTAIISKLAHIQNQPGQLDGAHGVASALTAVAKQYEEKKVLDVEMEQLGERAKREERFEKKIKALKAKIKELTPTKVTATKKDNK